MEPRGFGPQRTLGTLGSDTGPDSIKKLTFGKGPDLRADRTGQHGTNGWGAKCVNGGSIPAND